MEIIPDVVGPTTGGSVVSTGVAHALPPVITSGDVIPPAPKTNKGSTKQKAQSALTNNPGRSAFGGFLLFLVIIAVIWWCGGVKAFVQYRRGRSGDYTRVGSEAMKEV